MSIGSEVENALRVTFEFLNVVHLNVGHSEFRTHPRALVKLTLSTIRGVHVLKVIHRRIT